MWMSIKALVGLTLLLMIGFNLVTSKSSAIARTNNRAKATTARTLNITTAVPSRNNKGCPGHRLCMFFKPSNKKFNIERMVDVWQTIFYKNMDMVSCFKIYIRKISAEEREECYNKYGNFNGDVDWEKVELEVKADKMMLKKHYLQNFNDQGIMSNVIIFYDPDRIARGPRRLQNKSYVLQAESPDQWLVLNNLLFMRDCSNGGVLVFANSYNPTKSELDEGLKVFGESPGGNMICAGENSTNIDFNNSGPRL